MFAKGYWFSPDRKQKQFHFRPSRKRKKTKKTIFSTMPEKEKTGEEIFPAWSETETKGKVSISLKFSSTPSRTQFALSLKDHVVFVVS